MIPECDPVSCVGQELVVERMLGGLSDAERMGCCRILRHVGTRNSQSTLRGFDHYFQLAISSKTGSCSIYDNAVLH
jgi:hypothetical protein